MDTVAMLKGLADIRALADHLESLILESAELGATSAPPTVFDPDVDAPDVTPRFRGVQSPEDDWCALMLWASLRSINVRLGRGATKAEVVQIAKDAGYRDGRGWNRWTGWEERADGRWLTDLGHLRYYYKKVNRTLPADLDATIE